MPLDIDRHLKFWRCEETDRPLLTFHCGSYYPLERYPNLAAKLPDGHLRPSDIDIPALLRDYERLRQMYEQVDDDSVFVASSIYGFPFLEAILGCPVSPSRISKSFRTEPFLDDWAALDSLNERLNLEWVDKWLDVNEALISQANGAYPVPLPNLRLVSDMMGAARGSMQLPLDCYDYPEEVERFASLCLEIWMRVMDTFQPLAPRFEGGFGSRDYGLWAPEQVLVSQEDYAALLSPDLFRRFILFTQSEILQRFEYNVLHLHPPAIYMIDQVLGLPELKALELNYEPGGPDLESLIPIWQGIQAEKPLVIYASHINESEIGRIVTALDPRGLALHPVVGDAEDARLRDAVEEASSRRVHA